MHCCPTAAFIHALPPFAVNGWSTGGPCWRLFEDINGASLTAVATQLAACELGTAVRKRETVLRVCGVGGGCRSGERRRCSSRRSCSTALAWAMRPTSQTVSSPPSPLSLSELPTIALLSCCDDVCDLVREILFHFFNCCLTKQSSGRTAGVRNLTRDPARRTQLTVGVCRPLHIPHEDLFSSPVSM